MIGAGLVIPVLNGAGGRRNLCAFRVLERAIRDASRCRMGDKETAVEAAPPPFFDTFWS